MYALNHACLTADEEHQLALRAKAGDKAARQQLILSNMRFVATCCRTFRGLGLDSEELFSFGVVGLIEAVDHFDPHKHIRMTTYAKFWIRNAILHAIYASGMGVHLSEAKARKVIALKTGLSAPDADSELLSLLAQPPVSLDAPAGTENTNLLDVHLAASDARSLEDEVVQNCIRDDVRRAVRTLPAIDCEVIFSHYGLDGAKPEPFSAIGERHHKTKAWAHLVEKRAFAALRTSLEDYCT